MGHPFCPEAASRLDSAERLRLVPVDALLRCLPLRRGLRFLDVGCGTGTFFFPIFERLDGEGVFMAAELQEEMIALFLSRLSAYADHPRFTRIELVRAKPHHLPLPDASADLILLVHVYHELQNRAAYLKELRRLLARGGTLCLLDWKTAEEDPALLEEARPLGPPLSERVAEAQALRDLEEAGFRLCVSHSGFQHNWCLCARR